MDFQKAGPQVDPRKFQRYKSDQVDSRTHYYMEPGSVQVLEELELGLVQHQHMFLQSKFVLVYSPTRCYMAPVLGEASGPAAVLAVFGSLRSHT